MRLVNLIASNGSYVCAEHGGGQVGAGSLVANRTAALQWEQFSEEVFEDGVSLKTHLNTYITAELNGDVSTDRTVRGAWEKWYPMTHGYRSVHGRYLRLGAGDVVYADATEQNEDTQFDVVNLSPVFNLSQLRISGRYFYNEENQRVFVPGTTDFMLYKYFLEGKDITPILQQRHEHGVRCVRVIGMVSWFDYTPQKYGQAYYENIPAFLDLCATYGLYVYWTVFADTRLVMPVLNDQLRHFDRMVTQLKSRKNVILELVNEPTVHDNATANPMAFPRPVGIAASAGSYTETYPGSKEGKPAPPPYWDFFDFHTPRRDKSRVKDQCMVDNPNYLLGMAVLSGEPDKFGGPNEHNPKVYLNDPDLSRQMYQTARGTAAGYFYHTSAGNYSLLWNDVEIANCPFLMEA